MCSRPWEPDHERGIAVKTKHRRAVLILLVLLLAGGAGYFCVRVRDGGPTSIRPNRLSPQHPVQIRGFEFVGHHEGRKVLSIKADAFTVEKMRLGHFRVSLLNVARLKNGIIDLYGQWPQKEKSVSSPSPAEGARLPSKPQGSDRVTFGEAFSRKSLPSFGVKQVSSITIEPVTVKLHAEKSTVTEISAASATIRLKNRDVLFEGHVRVLSGSRALEADRVSFMPEDATLECAGPYELTVSGNTMRGGGFESDIFLRPLRQPRQWSRPAEESRGHPDSSRTWH
jgi:hypothetical protein